MRVPACSGVLRAALLLCSKGENTCRQVGAAPGLQKCVGLVSRAACYSGEL